MLNKEQIDLIAADVEKARLTIVHLEEELTDHICCEVESRMTNGKTFEEAYMEVKLISGISLLKKIEEETLLLISKKHRIMKTTMKITGNAGLGLIAMGTVFKIFHWPGASIILLLGFASILLFSFPAIIWLNNKESQSAGKGLMNFSLLIGASSLMTGILFKVMHWPGASPLLICGWLIIIGLFLPVLLWSKFKETNSKKEKSIYIVGALALSVFEFATLFKIMHWPGAAILMISGSVLLFSVFLPMYTWHRYKQVQKITGEYIFLIILSIYAVVITSLMSMNVSGQIRNIDPNQPVQTEQAQQESK